MRIVTDYTGKPCDSKLTFEFRKGDDLKVTMESIAGTNRVVYRYKDKDYHRIVDLDKDEQIRYLRWAGECQCEIMGVKLTMQ